jgi:Tfp pilus assembly protein PilN
MLTPTPNYPAWKLTIDLIQMFGTVAVAIYVWWSNREKVTSQRFAALEKEVSERVKRTEVDTIKSQRDKQCEQHKQDIKQNEQSYSGRLIESEKKIERIGSEIRNLPGHRHIEDLSRRIEQLHGDVHEVSGSLKGLSRAVDLMNEFLINQGGKK